MEIATDVSNDVYSSSLDPINRSSTLYSLPLVPGVSTFNGNNISSISSKFIIISGYIDSFFMSFRNIHSS